MLTYNSFIRLINDYFATPHLQIQRFEEGFYEDLNRFQTEGLDFPLMYIVPTDFTHTTYASAEYAVRIYYLDLLKNNLRNERDVLSDTLQISRDFTNWVRENQDNDINLIGNPRAIPVKNMLLDNVCGVYVDYVIELKEINSECYIPFSGGTIPAPICSIYEIQSDFYFGCSGTTYSVMAVALNGTEITSETWLIAVIEIDIDGTIVSVNEYVDAWTDRHQYVPSICGYVDQGYVDNGYVL
jgi:hypothetical protein